MKIILAKEWIWFFLFIFLCSLVSMGFISFISDPFIFYRNTSNDKKLLNSHLVNMGIIKNYNYNMAFIGSSEIHNIDMVYIRHTYRVKPVKLVGEDMTINEILKIYSLSQKYSKANQYFINVDIPLFDSIEILDLDLDSSKYPDFLYNESKLDDYKYLLGYEVCFQFVPVNFVINALVDFGIPLPEEIADKVNIDKIADWSKNTTFGKEVVKQNYFSSTEDSSAIDNRLLSNRMKENIDFYLEAILSCANKDQRIIFGFPPYSALYWYRVMKEGTFEAFLKAKEYFILQCARYDNIKVVDLQAIPEITNLDYYKDSIHYNGEIQKIYTDAIIFESVESSSIDSKDNKSQLQVLIKQFEKENSDWLQ